MELHLPIACSLEAGKVNEREQQWRALLVSPQAFEEKIPGGVRLHFRCSELELREVKSLVELEGACCPWIQWRVVEGVQSLTIDATAESQKGIQVLRSWFTASRGGSTTADSAAVRS